MGKVELENHEVVTLHRVLDGDEVSLQRKDGKTFVLRLLGVKCFDPLVAEPGIGAAGAACMNALERMLTNDQGAQLSVVFEKDGLKHDNRDRVLASLFVGEKDVGKSLVHDGRAMVFTQFKFDNERAYLAEQVAARLAGRGLWANTLATERADALSGQWQSKREAP